VILFLYSLDLEFFVPGNAVFAAMVQLPLAGLPTGGYYFAVQFEDGSVRNGKLVVQQ
jgi:hypothetical protein